jgi:DNA-binding NarL/FixJ family response regulator
LSVPEGEAEPDNLTSQPRHFLPEDLAGALKRLDETEIDTLLAAVTAEAQRRRRVPRPAAERPAPTRRLRSHAAGEDGAGSLTTGKLNAVLAAFKAGVKPSAIARQFGISQSDVRKALAAQGRERKSWR